jgi:hypothetical protein
MAVGVTIDVGNLPQELKKLNIQYRQSVLDAMADTLDLTRMLAMKKYIIPDAYPGESLRKKTRLQKTNPTRLTSRTGALLKMLKTGIDVWEKGPGTRRSPSPALQGYVRTTAGGKETESYIGTLTVNVKDPFLISKKRTKAQLAGRFLWDLPGGVRGVKRPFLTAALKELGAATIERKAKERLSRLGVL